MEEEDDGFYNIDLLLREEGLLNEGSTAPETFEHNLLREVDKDLTNTQRSYIAFKLLGIKNGQALPRGAQSDIAREIGVHRSTISRIFKEAQNQQERGNDIDVRNKKKGNAGRKRMEVDEEWLQLVSLHLRTTYRAYAGALGCSPSYVFNLLKRGHLRVHTSNNHPTVSDKHKIARMKWVLSHIIPGTPTSKPVFDDTRHTVHIDEKWFFLNPEMRRFYLLPAEIDPYKHCQSKRFRIKVMFMGVTSRPVYDEAGTLIHDGKFGIFPFIYNHVARNKSKNRPAGTVETKAVQNVSKDVIREMLITKVIPAIMERWPASMSKNIIIQQDNARPHISPNDPEFVNAATQNGFNIKLVCQPPQSPDLNVLDLGLFRAFQSLQYQSFPNTLDELIEKVQEAYWTFDITKIKFTWLQLQYVMIEILKVKGGNNYKNPHVGKERLQRIGQLPENAEVDQDLINEAVQYLNEHCNSTEDDVMVEDAMVVDAD